MGLENKFNNRPESSYSDIEVYLANNIFKQDSIRSNIKNMEKILDEMPDDTEMDINARGDYLKQINQSRIKLRDLELQESKIRKEHKDLKI